jgi:hypothetical protein
VADKSTQLMIDALSRAVTEPAGLPLFGNKKTPGLFTSTPAAKQIAQRCKEEDYLRILQTETKGKQVQEICAITEKGLAYLLSEASPKSVLEELVRTLESRRSQVAALLSTAQQWEGGLAALQATVEKVLQHLQQPASSVGPAPSGNGSTIWLAELVAFLGQWQASGTSGDCPLPNLYRRAQAQSPNLSIGHFHDGLRKLHDQETIYLHPWTGPLYEIPEPPFALLVGHEIAYYASLRRG